MESRRSFIRKTAIGTAALAVLPSFSKAKVNPTGLILYTVRQDMSRDPMGTLAAVAAMGYNWIEAADHSPGKFYGMEPARFRAAVKENGMKLLSTHSGINMENADQMSDDAAEAGMKYLVLPSLPGKWSRSLDGFREAADFMNHAGEICKSKGVRFAFHNHSVEFREIDGIVPFEILADNTDPELVAFELDLCWIAAADKDPVYYFNKYPGRFELWHMKDMTADKRDATMGEGILDFQPVVSARKKSGMKYFFVEQDNCMTHTPLESARISRDYIVRNLF